MIGIISRTEGKGSGAEMVLCHLLNNWNSNYPLLIVTAAESSVAKAAKANNIEVIELSFVPEKFWPNINTIEKQLRYLKRLRLVHAWNSKSFELAWYISKRLRIKLTCTMHDHPRAYYYTAKKLWLLKMVANSSVGLIAVSSKLKAACSNFGYTTEIKVIQNGLPDIIVSDKNNKGTKYIIGFLGMSSHVKGFEIVADWISKTKDNKSIEWLLYGNVCKEYEPIIQRIKGKGSDNFKVMGHTDPQIIFEQIDLLVSTSVFFDCFPTVLLEACRSGIPAIASSNGGADEIIEHEHTGFILNTTFPDKGFEYLKTLIDNKDKWMDFSKAARKRFEENFKVEQMVSKYSNFWKEKIIADK